MANVNIDIEYLWGSLYYPWLVTSSPWQTATPDGQITFNQQAPTIIEGIGLTISPTTETLIFSVPTATIIAGTGTSVNAIEDVLTFSVPTPFIMLDYTYNSSTDYVTFTVPSPTKIGALWEIRIKPSDIWIERDQLSSNWEMRNQVLWSPLIFPWLSTFYPWEVKNRREIPTYSSRTKPSTNYTNRNKPSTNWTL